MDGIQTGPDPMKPILFKVCICVRDKVVGPLWKIKRVNPKAIEDLAKAGQILKRRDSPAIYWPQHIGVETPLITAEALKRLQTKTRTK